MPVADDYDYLHHLLFARPWSWFDGCGSSLYWRPLARQAYYTTLGPWMLQHPLAVALVHMGCLCLAAALLYRAFRTTLGSATAFAVSTAPWMMESSRLLIAWPSCFQDLGALLFVSLALHEAVAARLWTFLGAGLAALLCKEVAAIALVTLPLCPAVQLDGERRRTWLISVCLLTAVWAAGYLWVHAHASLGFPVPGRRPWASLAWTLGIALVPWWSFKAIWSMSPATGPFDFLVIVGMIALILRSRDGAIFTSLGLDLRAWWTWGGAWSAPLTLSLLPFYPAWFPYRLAFVNFGILVAAMVTLRAAHRWALPAFILLRLVPLVLAPLPVHDVPIDPPFLGASIDVPRLSRLQRFVADVRQELLLHFPQMPHGSAVVRENFPAMTEYAFGSRPALHVWYRDTTLRWLPISQWMAHPSIPAVTIVEYQDQQRDQVALVGPESMRALIRAGDALKSGREAEALAWLGRAESLQVDRTAQVFFKSVRGKRAYALASLRFKEGRYHEARVHLLHLLADHPGDVPGRRMLATVDEILGRPPP